MLKSRSEDFYKVKGQLVKVSGFCKECTTKNNVEKRSIVKQKAIEYLGGKCSSCGYNKCQAALEFHHVNPKEKDKNYHNFKTEFNERLKNELNKCILLCANCHKEYHFNENKGLNIENL